MVPVMNWNESELCVATVFIEQSNTNQKNKIPSTTPLITDTNICVEALFHPTLLNAALSFTEVITCCCNKQEMKNAEDGVACFATASRL
jgi:hypothetical protein